MTKSYKYSDEHISAYIDDELDNEERARILSDEHNDNDLARRISDARTLKEKVQLAYAGIEQTENEAGTTGRLWNPGRARAMVAGLISLLAIASLYVFETINADLNATRNLIANTQLTPADSLKSTIGNNRKVLISLSHYQIDTIETALQKIELVLQENSGNALELEFVADKQGLKVLDERSPYSKTISRLSTDFDNLEIVACAKSLANLTTEGDSIKLIRSIITTPSAVQQISKRTHEGWFLIRI